jgi:HrpA-like RNA helicase
MITGVVSEMRKSVAHPLLLDWLVYVQGCLDAHRRFHSAQGDLHTALNVFNAFLAVKGNAVRKRWMREHFVDTRALTRAMSVRRQLRQICERHGFQVRYTPLGWLLLATTCK